MNTDVAFENLTALTALLEAQGLRSWLHGGTLLGCYRGGALLEHDRDLDLGLHITDWRRAPALSFLAAARAAGFTVKRYFGQVSRGLEICLDRGGIHTDLMFFYPEDDRVWSGYWPGTWHSALPGEPRNCRLIKFYYERFELRPLRVQGVEFQIPANTEEYLVLLYGKTWRTPDPVWTSMQLPPSAVQTGYVVERDPAVVIEEEFLASALPRADEPEIVDELVASPVMEALMRARARKRAARAAARKAEEGPGE